MPPENWKTEWDNTTEKEFREKYCTRPPEDFYIHIREWNKYHTQLLLTQFAGACKEKIENNVFYLSDAVNDKIDQILKEFKNEA